MEKREMAVSQSMMKSLSDYLKGEECGIVFKEKFVNKRWGSPTDAMLLGQYFEYKATGQLPKDGTIPQPIKLKNGSLSVDFERATASALFAKTLFQVMGIKILELGKYLNFRDADGVLDIRAEFKGKKAIIDLKYSGLLDDKWNDIGWNIETLNEKDRLMIQAVHYKYLCDNIYSEEHDFYFMLFNTKEPVDVRMIKVNIDPLTTARHIEQIKQVRAKMTQLVESDNFKPRGSLLKCSKCYLQEECPSRVILPQIQEVYY